MDQLDVRIRVSRVTRGNAYVTLVAAISSSPGLLAKSTAAMFDMHVHDRYNRHMRTTVELKPEHRSALLALAARRGEKGFSTVLEEAVDMYLAAEADRQSRRQHLLSLRGSLSLEEGDELRRLTGELRDSWR